MLSCAMIWGARYLAHGVPRAIVEDAITSILAGRCSVEVVARSEVRSQLHIRALRSGFNWRDRWVAQDMTIDIRPTNKGTAIRVDHRWQTRARVLGVLCWVLVSGLCTSGLYLFVGGAEATHPSMTLAALLLLVVAALAYVVLESLLKERSWRGGLMLDMHRAIEVAGAKVEHQWWRSSSRESAMFWALLVSFVGACLFTIRDHATSLAGRSRAGVPWVALLLVVGSVVVLGFLALLALGVLRRGSDRRLTMALPGLLSVGAVAILQGSLIGFNDIGRLSPSAWSKLTDLRRRVDEGGGALGADGRVLSAAELKAILAQARAMCGVHLACYGFVLLGSFGFALWGVRLSREVLAASGQLLHGRDATAMQARSGSGFLGVMRPILLIAVGVLVLASAALEIYVLVSTCTALRLCGGSPFGSLRDGAVPDEGVGVLIGLSYDVGFVFDLPDHHPVAVLGARSAWLVGLAVVPVASVLALVDRLIMRHLARRRLRAVESAAEHKARLSSLIGSLCAEIRVAQPRLVVVPSRFPHGAAYEYGKREKYILVTSACVEVLSEDELRALLAHELAHLVRGHCRRHNRLQMLARITLVGGAFAGVIEDSVHNELEADRTAVQRLGIDPAVLRSALVQMRAAAHLAGSAGVLLGALAFTDRNAGEQSRGVGVFQAWLRLFRSDTELTYWHPSIEERIRVLEGA